MDVHFTRPIYKHILGLPISFADLEAVDPDHYKSLKSMLEQPLAELGIGQEDLNFTVYQNQFGKQIQVELIEHGADIPVTDANKRLYIKLIANHYLTKSCEAQIKVCI